MKKKWTAYEKFLFATQKLRAQQIPDRKKEQSKRQCRQNPQED